MEFIYFLGKETKAPAKRITPLFQVAYDRSLCKPLGTLFDFNKIRVKNVTTAPITSRSPSPVLMERSPQQESIVRETPKPVPVKKSEKRQNALLIFEFSTAYPFIYGNNKFKCFICTQPFLDITVLRDHMANVHTFASLKRLLNNKKECVLKVEVSDLACKICSSPLNDLVEIKHHLKSIHQKPIDAELKDNMIPFKLELPSSFDCVICSQSFIKLRPLVIHMNVHFNNYSCEICGTGFMTLRLLKTHLEVHESGSYPCDRCDKVFSTTHKRSIHVRGVHLKQYPRRCPMCPERFNSNYRRTIHLQDVHHQSTRVHKCETCGRAFHLKYHLICHNRSVHLQERNHQCKICTQRFCNKETLKRHMVIHTGEKNYKCDFCGLAFLRRKNLKDHLRSHDVV
ncbi:zinc finger protein 728-like [Pieris brassicae]|uniref:zinc finger protein 728-like n=1 Tax=Pieris brassicae TaxID=7116 RepID=UPI001E660EBB|nr:zinc finger protein 728-like [Pieris brassicae]